MNAAANVTLYAKWITITLGNYAAATIPNAGGNTIVTPDVAPTSTTYITAYSSTNFKGKLVVNPATGVVTITNAHPAGTYTVTVNAGSGVLKTFSLTVGNPSCVASYSLPNSIVTVNDYLSYSQEVGDFNNDGHQDFIKYGPNGLQTYLGNGKGGFTAYGSGHLLTNEFGFNLVLADFNGDGNLDVASNPIRDVNSRFLKIYLGDGLGGLNVHVQANPIIFGAGGSTFTGEVFPSLKSGDFNNDGITDLFQGSLNHGVFMFRGNGDGTFTPIQHDMSDDYINFSYLGIYGSVQIGDFNQDGKSDIFCNTIAIGNNNFSFSPITGLDKWFSDSDNSDFNNDGDQDLVLLSGASDPKRLYFILGTNIPNDATFGPANEIVVSPKTIAVAAGDINGDGFQDIVSGGLNQVTIHFGNGNGSFVSSVTLAITGQVYTIRLADFNEDGKTDFLVNGAVLILDPKVKFSGKGIAIANGSKAPTVTNGTDFEWIVNGTTKTNEYTLTNKSVNAITITSIGMTGAAAASFSISGINLSSPISLAVNESKTFNVTFNPALFAVGVQKATVNFVVNTCFTTGFEVVGTSIKCSPGTLAAPTHVPAGSYSIAMAQGDFNEDGNQDVATLNYFPKTLSIRLGNGNGGFNGTMEIPVGLSSTFEKFDILKATIGVGDFNGDGHLDLAVPTLNANITLLYGNGWGAFPNNVNIAITSGSVAIGVNVGQFNADGIADFSVVCGDYYVYNNKFVKMILSNGSGSYTVTSTTISGKALLIQDFDKDGLQDIVNFGELDGQFFKGNSNGTYQTPVVINFGGSYRVIVDIVAADFNKDGNLDFALANYYGTIDLYQGDGAGNFVFYRAINPDYDPTSIKTGDLDGDGDVDLISTDYGGISLFKGDGIGGFGNNEFYNQSNDKFTDVMIGDFNKDGVQDVLGSLSGYYVWLGNAGNEINVKGNANDIVSGDATPSTTDATNFGNVVLNTPVIKIYTIQNTGSSALTVSGIASGGNNAADFVVGGIALPAKIAAGNSATFNITFTPITSGTKTATVTINSNDCDEGAYTFALQGSSCATPVWTGTVSTAWINPGNWSCGVVPSSASDVIIAAAGNQPILTSNVSIHTLTLNAGTTMTVPTGLNLTVSNYIHNSGTLTVENNANLIQVDDVTNTGNIMVQRNSAPIVRLDYTLWSSPVTGQNLFAFSPATLTNRFYTYNTNSNSYTTAGLDSNSTFIKGQGFSIRAPNNQTTVAPAVWQGTFTGIPNNGTIPLVLDGTLPGYNLVGNPYPSTIDADAFINANSSITGTLYFYAHSLSMDANGVFPSGTNYATWNSLGSTVATHIIGDVHLIPVGPTGTIQVGQGFLVKAIASGSLNFNNAMRVANNANQNFRTAAVEKDRLWLNLKTDTGVDINQILVGYITGATLGADRNYDGLAFGNTGSSISSKIGGDDYAIQGRSLPFDSSDRVPLGFKAATAGNYTIALTNSDGLFAGNQEVFLKDNLTGIEHNIKVSPYTFTSQAGTFDTRFSLVYAKTLGLSSNSFKPNSVLVYKVDEWFNIKTNGITMKEVLVYDLTGRLIFKQSGVNATTTVLKGLSKVNEAMLLKIVSQENEIVTVKVIN